MLSFNPITFPRTFSTMVNNKKARDGPDPWREARSLPQGVSREGCTWSGYEGEGEGLVLRKCCIFGAIIMFVVVITVGLALQNVWRNADFPGAGEKQRQGVHSAQPGGSLAQGINTGNCQLALSIPLAFPFHWGSALSIFLALDSLAIKSKMYFKMQD